MQQACSETEQEQDTEAVHASLLNILVRTEQSEFSYWVCSHFYCCFSSCFLEREQGSPVHAWTAGCLVQPVLFMMNQWKWDGMGRLYFLITCSEHSIAHGFIAYLSPLFPSFIHLLRRNLHWFQTGTVNECSGSSNLVFPSFPFLLLFSFSHSFIAGIVPIMLSYSHSHSLSLSFPLFQWPNNRALVIANWGSYQ